MPDPAITTLCGVSVMQASVSRVLLDELFERVSTTCTHDLLDDFAIDIENEGRDISNLVTGRKWRGCS